MSQYDHSGHRSRMKQRFLKDLNFDNFEPHNILELVLFYSIPRRDTNELAHRLIDRFGSLSAVLDAPVDELIKEDGISENTACLLKMFIPLARAYNNDKYNEKTVLDTPDKISDFLLAQYIGYQDEVLSLISMDNCCRVLSYDIVVRGTNNHVAADTRRMIEILLRSGASSAILAHNHPGGFALPSLGDIKATRNVNFALKNIGVRLLDHYIIAADECISLKQSKEYADLFG